MIQKEDVHIGDVITIRGKRRGSVTSGEVVSTYIRETNGDLVIAEGIDE